MNERDIRLLFEAGHWSDAVVHYDEQNKGWFIALNVVDGGEQQLLTSKRGMTRLFKTSDTALSWCREIGFHKITVKLEGQSHSDTSHSTILLVEDNDDDIELTLRAFQKHDSPHEVIVVKNGEEALNYMFARGEYTMDRALPDLILLDLNLPRVSGHEVLQEIKQHDEFKNIPVVILTTSDEKSDIVKGYELGSNSYILKSVDYETFTDTLAKLRSYWLDSNLSPVTTR